MTPSAAELEQTGVKMFQAGEFSRAAECFALALQCGEKTARLYHNLALSQFNLGQFEQARRVFEQALAADPRHVEAHFNLGRSLKALGLYEEAVTAYRKSIGLDPQHERAWNNTGIALHCMGKRAEAIAAYESALSIKRFPAAHFNLANVFRELKNSVAAEEQYKKALELNPNLTEAANNLASLLLDEGRLEEAAHWLRTVTNSNPYFWAARTNIGNVQLLQGNIEGGIATYREVLEGVPGDNSTRSNMCFALHYHWALSAKEIFQEHKLFGMIHTAKPLCTLGPREIVEGEKIRVGYVSADLREHPVAYFLQALLENYDRERFEVVCFSDVKAADEMTTALRAKCGTWFETSHLSDNGLADFIHKQAIDILIDLSGHTAFNRMLVFAKKPARIQATWLGYPDTTGLTSIDYRITDDLCDPPGAEELHTEKLLKLPGCFLAYTSPKSCPEVAPAPVGRNGYITFGSFNIFPKVNPPLMAMWSQILRGVPNSRLVLKNRSFNDEKTKAYVRNCFAVHGIPENRVTLLGYYKEKLAHLTAYQEIDIALDTYPYNGTTTTCEALWMGVPVVTLAGDRHAARVGQSLLQATGNEGWIAGSADEYIAKAIALAGELSGASQRRQELREKMRMSCLCDGAAYARNFEVALIGMCRK